MNLIVILKALVMGVIALLMLYIVVLMVRAASGSGPARKQSRSVAAPRRCERKRDGDLCGKPLYRCSNCLEEGCQMKECEGRCFKAPGNCLRCGFGNTMEPV